MLEIVSGKKFPANREIPLTLRGDGWRAPQPGAARIQPAPNCQSNGWEGVIHKKIYFLSRFIPDKRGRCELM
jgi:hypothetical protein